MLCGKRMNIVKKLKQVFCWHEYEKFDSNQQYFTITYEVCRRCGLGNENKIIYHPNDHKKECNFSIVKGMAEYERIYKKYYD
jgi:hypothetical protein